MKTRVDNKKPKVQMSSNSTVHNTAVVICLLVCLCCLHRCYFVGFGITCTCSVLAWPQGDLMVAISSQLVQTPAFDCTQGMLAKQVSVVPAFALACAGVVMLTGGHLRGHPRAGPALPSPQLHRHLPGVGPGADCLACGGKVCLSCLTVGCQSRSSQCLPAAGPGAFRPVATVVLPPQEPPRRYFYIPSIMLVLSSHTWVLTVNA